MTLLLFPRGWYGTSSVPVLASAGSIALLDTGTEVATEPATQAGTIALTDTGRDRPKAGSV